jgi:hypothetical protein
MSMVPSLDYMNDTIEEATSHLVKDINVELERITKVKHEISARNDFHINRAKVQNVVHFHI